MNNKIIKFPNKQETRESPCVFCKKYGKMKWRKCPLNSVQKAVRFCSDYRDYFEEEVIPQEGA